MSSEYEIRDPAGDLWATSGAVRAEAKLETLAGNPMTPEQHAAAEVARLNALGHGVFRSVPVESPEEERPTILAEFVCNEGEKLIVEGFVKDVVIHVEDCSNEYPSSVIVSLDTARLIAAAILRCAKDITNG